MADNTELNEFVKFDEENGLSVSTQAQIFDDLTAILKSSYGSDFVIQEGSEMYTFLDLLATSLAHSAGAYKKVYDSLGFIGATGVTLDNAVSLAGITRNGLIRSSVNMTITRTDTGEATIPAPIRIRDINGNTWECYADILLEENVTETMQTFYASDGNTENPYDIFIKAYNGNGVSEGSQYWNILTVTPTNVNFQNKEDSVLGEEKESDAHLRYRYFTALHSGSTATVDGLKSKLLNINNMDLSDVGISDLERPLQSVYIYQNNTDTPASQDQYNVTPHSIWVIVDGHTTWNGTGNTTTDEDDINIAKIIKYFKSLGVNTSYGKSKNPVVNGEGAIIYNDNGEEIKFSRAEVIDCYVDITLSWKQNILEDDKDNIISAIKEKVKTYINDLGIGNDVLFTGISAAIYSLYPALNYSDYVFDVTDLKIGNTSKPTGTRLNVDIYQYAQPKDITIN